MTHSDAINSIVASPEQLAIVKDFFTKYPTIQSIADNISTILQDYPINHQTAPDPYYWHIYYVIYYGINLANIQDKWQVTRSYRDLLPPSIKNHYTYNKLADIAIHVPAAHRSSMLPTNVINAINRKKSSSTSSVATLQDNLLSHKAFEHSNKSITIPDAIHYIQTIKTFTNTQSLYLDTILTKVSTYSNTLTRAIYEYAYRHAHQKHAPIKYVVDHSHSPLLTCDTKYVIFQNSFYYSASRQYNIPALSELFTGQHARIYQVVGGLTYPKQSLDQFNIRTYYSRLNILYILLPSAPTDHVKYYKLMIDSITNLLTNKHNIGAFKSLIESHLSHIPQQALFTQLLKDMYEHTRIQSSSTSN
jgi:hypothetical protein